MGLAAGGLGSSWALPLAGCMTDLGLVTYPLCTLFSCTGSMGILDSPPPTPEMLAWSGIMDMKACGPHGTFKMFCCFLGRIISSVPQLCRCPQWLSHILKDSEMQLASLPNQMGSHICLPQGLAQPQPAGPQQRSFIRGLKRIAGPRHTPLDGSLRPTVSASHYNKTLFPDGLSI